MSIVLLSGEGGVLYEQFRQILADWVEAGMKAKGWGVVELADIAGVTRESIWEIRNLKVNPKMTTLDALAKAMGMDIPTLTVRDNQGRADYVAGLRAACRIHTDACKAISGAANEAETSATMEEIQEELREIRRQLPHESPPDAAEG